MTTVRVITMVLSLIVLTGTVRAQIIDPGTPTSSTSMAFPGGAFYNFASGSGCDLSVSVWGYVRNPGRYNIPCETNLLELLSYCGGPQVGNVDPFLYKVKIVRKGGVDNADEIREVFEVDLTKYLTVKSIAMNTDELRLWPGDLVIIDGEQLLQTDWLLRSAQILVAISQILTSALAIYTIIENTKD